MHDQKGKLLHTLGCFVAENIIIVLNYPSNLESNECFEL